LPSSSHFLAAKGNLIVPTVSRGEQIFISISFAELFNFQLALIDPWGVGTLPFTHETPGVRTAGWKTHWEKPGAVDCTPKTYSVKAKVGAAPQGCA
jgi:hypothetical protein